MESHFLYFLLFNLITSVKLTFHYNEKTQKKKLLF